MPQDSCLVFHNPDIGANVDTIVFNKRPITVIPRDVEHLAQFKKPGEAPVALHLSKAMVGRMVAEKRRIIAIPEDQRELNAATPVLGDLVCLKTMF